MTKVKANILIVEDEWIVAEDIKSSLKNLGYRVADIVSSGEKVIAKVEEHNPDLVLMDIMLKGQMDGIEAASRIHSRFDIPIVYLTAYTDEKLLERAKITEPYGYIVKPFENRELSTAVEIALYKHNVEKQLKDAYIRLDKKKDLLEKIFSTSYGLIAYMDRDFNFIRVNRAYAEADNKAQDFFLGKNHFDLYPDKGNEAIFRKVIDTGEAYTAYAKPFEYAEHPERGASYWDWHVVPSTNYKGEVDGLIFTLEDVTERVKTEKALRESQKELKSLFDNMQDTFYRADIDGRMTMISPSSSELVQYTPEELVGQRLADFYVDPDGREKFLKALEEGRGKVHGYEAAVRRKDGSEVWVSTNAHIYFNESGDPAGVEGSIRDITKRKQAEEDLRASEERYALAMNGANDGLWDRDLKTGAVYFSPRWKELLGFKNEEFLDSEEEWKKRVHPDDYGRILKAREDHLNRKTQYYITEFRMKHKDGTYRWVLARGATIRDEEGTPVRFAGSHTDITERKRMEEALLDQVKFINNTIESLPYPFMVIDAADYTIKLANSAASDKPAIEGMTCYKVLYNKRKPPKEKDLICPLEEVKKTGRPARVEHVHKDKSGNKQYIEVHGYPIFDKDGDLVQMILYTVDITDRKKAEEELKESHEKLRSLAGHIEAAREEERTAVARDIHDELGQVLTACKFDISWTAGKLDPNQKDLFERLDAASDHIDGAIQTVKRIATELRPALLDDLGLTAAIEWQAEEFQRRTGIESNLAFGPWNVLLSREITTAVFRLFQEALTNVARHSGATKVYAILKGDDGHLVLEVIDNGKGIAKRDLSAAKSFGLTGMRERVFALGGEIDISGIKGEGTKVTATIPLHNNHIKGRKDEKDSYSG